MVEINMASVSPRIEGNEIGSLVDGVPRNAGAKEGFAVCTGAAIWAEETLCVGTVAAAILLLGGIAAGVEGGASSVIVVVHDQK